MREPLLLLGALVCWGCGGDGDGGSPDAADAPAIDASPVDGGGAGDAFADDARPGDAGASPDAPPGFPTAVILDPGDGETRMATSTIAFIGQGTDPEDGVLTGGSLVWTSSRDGLLGVGEGIDTLLTIGVHTITLTATDSAGNMGSDSISLNVE